MSVGVGVFLSSEAESVAEDETFTVVVEIEPGDHAITGVRVSVTFDADRVAIEAIEVGDLLGASPLVGQESTDSTSGEVWFAAATTDSEGASEPGTLLVISAQALEALQPGEVFTVEEGSAIDESFEFVQDIAILGWR